MVSDILKKEIQFKFNRENNIWNQIEVCEQLDGEIFFNNLTKDIESLFVVYEGENLITERVELYLSIFFPSFICSEVTLKKILRDMVSKIKEENKHQVINLYLFFDDSRNYNYLLNNDYDFMLEKELSSILIEKKNEERNNNIFDNKLVIKKAERKDIKNVIDCIINAFLYATNNKEFQKIGKEKFIDNIIDYYSPFLIEDRVSFVAYYDQKFAGHISYDISENHNSIKIANMIDVFVIHNFKKFGIEKKLIEFSHSYMYKNNILNIKGRIDNSIGIDNMLKIYKNLNNDNWVVEGILYKLE